MARPTIITCAVTGNLTRPEQTPYLPITPEQIADSAVAAGQAGAAIAHIHVRDPVTGGQSMEIAYYREVMQRIAASGSDIIVNLTTGPGGRYVPSDDDPAVAGPGTSIKSPDIRVAHIVELQPEISSLDLNTMWSMTAAVINTPRNLRIMAERILAAGTKPELEVFDSGDVHIANDFIAEGVLPRDALFQIVTGVKYGAASTPQTLQYMHSLLPRDAVWAAFGVGRMQFPMLAQAHLMGGHVRVGLEDNVYLEKGRLAKSNAQLVEKGVRIIRDLGGTIATPAEARALLNLKPRPAA
jgi:uncharacterized protein (DUF849 family)